MENNLIKVGIHQPNFMPYPGFFNKIYQSDRFVILDNVDFNKRDWHNRNYIKTHNGKFLLTIPVNSYRNAKINDITIASNYNSSSILKTIEQNYKKSKYFLDYFDKIEYIFKCINPGDKLLHLNMMMIEFLLLGLQLKIPHFIYASDLRTEHLTNNELLAYITKEVGGNAYLSGPGASDYLSSSVFNKFGLKLLIQDYKCESYDQLYHNQGFFENLSTLDLLFNTGPEAKNFVFINSYCEILP